ncbi:hypothetical protein GCM10008965_51190 [Methylorubrum aminovorans]
MGPIMRQYVSWMGSYSGAVRGEVIWFMRYDGVGKAWGSRDRMPVAWKGTRQEEMRCAELGRRRRSRGTAALFRRLKEAVSSGARSGAHPFGSAIRIASGQPC